MIGRLTYDLNFIKSSNTIIFSSVSYNQKGCIVNIVQNSSPIYAQFRNFGAINSINLILTSIH